MNALIIPHKAWKMYLKHRFFVLFAVYVGGQNQWQGAAPAQQTRMVNPATSQPSNTYQKRARKAIKIIDPNTGEDINMDDVASTTGAKPSNTPPQSGSSSSRDTPVSVSYH